ARRWLKPLGKLDTPLAHAYVVAFEGIFALRAGEFDAGQRRLVEAIHLFETADTPQLAMAARCQLGRTLGGVEGERMTAEALAWMTAAGVANPARMIDLLLPPV
ncbi:MAG: hypothetical protein ACXVDD_26410, partial [Polyangia bacterium]